MKILTRPSRTFTLISLLSLFAFTAHAPAQRYAFTRLGGSQGLHSNTASTQSHLADPAPNYAVRDSLNFVDLYAFCPGPELCSDGIFPQSVLIPGPRGYLYGTTSYGGINQDSPCGFGAPGCGTVFEVNPTTGRERMLYSFCSQSPCIDGGYPVAGLTQDSAGNFYGTTVVGGSTFGTPNGNCLFVPAGTDGRSNDNYGCGTIFKLDPQRHESVLYNFCAADFSNNCAGGALPYAGLLQDAAGNLYGTTSAGGYANCQGHNLPGGCGTVFTLDPAGNETVIYSFCPQSSCADGALPYSGLIQDSAGNLYGTTTSGGANGGGTVFELEAPAQPGAAWSHIVLYSFCSASNCTDGENPYAGLIQDSAGNLYGTTVNGGTQYHNYSCSGGCGTVFQLEPPAQPGGTWTENVLHSFRGSSNPNSPFCISNPYRCGDGAYPVAGLIQDADGNLYGTTEFGGAPASGICSSGCGSVFMVHRSPGGSWHEQMLYPFCVDLACDDGESPVGALFRDALGNLYGTTTEGGGFEQSGCFNLNGTCGVIFALATPKAAVTLTSSPDPAKIDQPVKFSVVVYGAATLPTGTVTFAAGKTDLGTVTLNNGQASFTTAFTKSGTFSIRAIYSGDDNFKPATSKPLRQVVK